MTGGFDLLETLRWTPDGGCFMLDRHLSRLAASSRHFGFVCDISRIDAALNAAVRSSTAPLRVRLLLAADGAVRVESTALEPPAAPARVVLARAPVDRSDVFLRHKTTNRKVYEDARRSASSAEVDDVILWNADRQVTESTIANIVVEVDGRKLTPPLECGLLGGTFRAQLLDDREIEEGIVAIDQLQTAPGVWLINSVREWWPARLESQTATAMASAPISTSPATASRTNRSQR